MAQHPSRTATAEHRWPAVVGVIAALVLYWFLPTDLVPVQHYIVPAICLLMLVPTVVLNPHRLTKETRCSRWFSVILAAILVVANQVTVVLLVVALVSGSHEAPSLLLASLQVWVTNVIAFALLFWELDRGGPVSRTMLDRSELPVADFRFPQDEDKDAITEVSARSSAVSDWTPRFVDYIYTSLSNSMAYSAADAMPLSHRFKLMNGFQAFVSFVILALVIARAVSLIH